MNHFRSKNRLLAEKPFARGYRAPSAVFYETSEGIGFEIGDADDFLGDFGYFGSLFMAGLTAAGEKHRICPFKNFLRTSAAGRTSPSRLVRENPVNPPRDFRAAARKVPSADSGCKHCPGYLCLHFWLLQPKRRTLYTENSGFGEKIRKIKSTFLNRSLS